MPKSHAPFGYGPHTSVDSSRDHSPPRADPIAGAPVELQIRDRIRQVQDNVQEVLDATQAVEQGVVTNEASGASISQRNARGKKDAISARTAAIARDDAEVVNNNNSRISMRGIAWRRLPVTSLPASWRVPDWFKNPLPNIDWETSYPGLLPTRLTLFCLQYRSKEIRQLYGTYVDNEANGTFLTKADLIALICEVKGIAEHQRRHIPSRVLNKLNELQRNARDFVEKGEETTPLGRLLHAELSQAVARSSKAVYLSKMIERIPSVELTLEEEREIRRHVDIFGIEVL
jgi:hypothetical protein